jgi:hypothetical protein
MADTVILTAGLKQERDFWMNKLSGELFTSPLIPDFQRSKVYSLKADHFETTLPVESSRRLFQMTGGSPFLLYATLMAALKVCLRNYSGNDLVIVGSPAFKNGSEPAPGPNALAILDAVDSEMSFKQLLLNVRASLSEAYSNRATLSRAS